jgi:hypothetical protein
MSLLRLASPVAFLMLTVVVATAAPTGGAGRPSATVEGTVVYKDHDALLARAFGARPATRLLVAPGLDQFDWSSGDRSLAYTQVASHPSVAQVTIARLDASTARRLITVSLHDGSGSSGIALSPDGRSVAVGSWSCSARAPALSLVRVDGSVARYPMTRKSNGLPFDGWDDEIDPIAWLRSGALVYETQHGAICEGGFGSTVLIERSAAGKGRRLLGPDESIFATAISPDGKRVAATVCEGDDEPCSLAVVPTSGGRRVVHARALVALDDPDIAWDARGDIVYSWFEGAYGAGGVAELSSDGLVRHVITAYGTDVLAVSASGDRIAYRVPDGRSSRVVVVTREGSVVAEANVPVSPHARIQVSGLP